MAWFACLQPQARNTCPSRSTGGAIFLIQFGKNPSPVCPAVKEAGAAELATTGALSMRSSGLCARALRGETRPPDFGGWSDTRRRFTRWRDNGVWERPPEIPIDEPDPAWLMIDAGHCGVHPHAAGARGGNRDMIRAKGGSTQNRIWPRMRMACRSGLL
mgnify:FL=1